MSDERAGKLDHPTSHGCRTSSFQCTNPNSLRKRKEQEVGIRPSSTFGISTTVFPLYSGENQCSGVQLALLVRRVSRRAGTKQWHEEVATTQQLLICESYSEYSHGYYPMAAFIARFIAIHITRSRSRGLRCCCSVRRCSPAVAG